MKDKGEREMLLTAYDMAKAVRVTYGSKKDSQKSPPTFTKQKESGKAIKVRSERVNSKSENKK